MRSMRGVGRTYCTLSPSLSLALFANGDSPSPFSISPSLCATPTQRVVR